MMTLRLLASCFVSDYHTCCSSSDPSIPSLEIGISCRRTDLTPDKSLWWEITRLDQDSLFLSHGTLHNYREL